MMVDIQTIDGAAHDDAHDDAHDVAHRENDGDGGMSLTGAAHDTGAADANEDDDAHGVGVAHGNDEPHGVAAARVRTDESGRFARVAERTANASPKQKIVTLRVCAAGDSRWPGTTLMAALEAQGLAFGRYQVYHRNHADGRSMFCVASLVEPGSFEPARMAEQEFRGITAFAVLPGPAPPLHTVDALLATAHGLAESLSGQLQDAGGTPLSVQSATVLREEVARFQAQLP
jgi:cell division protein ZipA